MAKSTKIWDGSTWHDLNGLPGPSAVSKDSGNASRLGSDGLIFTPPGGGGAGLVDTSAYLFCKTGESLAARYAQAKALKPNGSPLGPENRATLIVLPGTYALSSELEVDAEFVDILGLGGTPGNQAVLVINDSLMVTADDVRISGISVGELDFRTNGNPLQVFENCRGGDFSWNADLAGTFIKCRAGAFSFGGGYVLSGTFIDCECWNVGDYGPAGDTRGFACFASGGVASGTFIRCSAGNVSFGSGARAQATGVFIDCRAGARSFGGDTSFPGCGASGTFIRCASVEYDQKVSGPGTGGGGFWQPLETCVLLYCEGLNQSSSGYPEPGAVIRYCLNEAYDEVSFP